MMVSKYDCKGADRSFVDVTYDFWFKYLFFDDTRSGRELLEHSYRCFFPSGRSSR